MKILLDTNILVHAYNKSSPYRSRAVDVLRGALQSEIDAAISSQVLYEFFAVITNPRRVEHPVSAGEAADLCLDLWECDEIEKVAPTAMAPKEALQLAEDLKLRGGAIFDCVLAITARENDIEAIYTENTDDFEGYGFLKVFNPFANTT
jgi:hypothetical protein